MPVTFLASAMARLPCGSALRVRNIDVHLRLGDVVLYSAAMDFDDFDIVPGNPWFETSSALWPFIEFQSRLEAIGRWNRHLARTMGAYLEDQAASVESDVAFIAENLPGWEGETRMFGEEDLGWTRTVIPVVAFGAAMSAPFAAVESLLQVLVKDVEERVGVRYKRRTPHVEGYLGYLAEHDRFGCDWDEADQAQFRALRSVRNKVAHALGDRANLDSLGLEVPTGPGEHPGWGPELVDATLTSVGILASAVEADR